MLVKNGLCPRFQKDWPPADKNERALLSYVAGHSKMKCSNGYSIIAYKILEVIKSIFGKSNYQQLRTSSNLKFKNQYPNLKNWEKKFILKFILKSVVDVNNLSLANPNLSAQELDDTINNKMKDRIAAADKKIPNFEQYLP